MDIAETSPGTHKWVFITVGIIEIILGCAALGIALFVGTAIVWLLGVLFLVAMVVNLYQAFTAPHYRLWNLFSGLVYGLLGVLFLWYPFTALLSLTMLIGWLLVIGGAIRLVMSAKTKNGWLVFNGIITLLLGIMIVATLPESATWVLGTFVAVDLIFSGWALIGMGGIISSMNRKN